MSTGSSASFVQSLHEFYGPQHRPPADLFQFFVWEILSEGAATARRDLSWQALKRIPALTPDAMFRTPEKALAEAVGLAGPHREEKLGRLLATVGAFRRQRDTLDDHALRSGRLLGAFRRLDTLGHIDTATRMRALLYCGDFLVLPIDDGIGRLVWRLMDHVESGSPSGPDVPHSSNRGRRRVRQWLAARLPRELDAYRDAVMYLRHHAEHTCVPVGPHCAICPLRTTCPSARES